MEQGILPDGAPTASAAPTTAPARDLRDWLSQLSRIDELRVVEGADWDCELGAISELNYKRRPTPALLFDHIPGYPPGHRVLTGSYSSAARVALTLGLGERMTDAEVVAALRGKPNEWEQAATNFPPIVVPDARLLENVRGPNEVDLLQFPVPRWHRHDGGRYIGTGNVVITVDPEEDWSNLGTYRMMVVSPNEVALNVVAGHHGMTHYRRWFEREGRAPIAVSFGHDPLLSMLGGIEVPYGTSEYAYAGAVLGRGVEVVLGEVTGLPIPASSEIAIEGYVYPDRTVVEGPFGEWMGYYSSSERPALLLRIERLYFRDDPIILGSPPSRPPHDYSYMRSVMKSAMIQDALVKAGVPGVKMVWTPELGTGRLLVIVQIEQRFAGHSRQAGFCAAQVGPAAQMNRYVIVVDDDVDPTSLDEVMWAVATRSDPATDVDVLRRSWGSRANPLLVDSTAPFTARAVIDACIPFERRASFPRVAAAHPAYLAEIARKWDREIG